MTERQGRYRIDGRLTEEGRPLVTISDSLANQTLVLSLEEALEMAAQMALATRWVLQQMTARAAEARKAQSIVIPGRKN